MNFSYGVIAVVGILAVITIGLISISPDQIIQPRVMTDTLVDSSITESSMMESESSMMESESMTEPEMMMESESESMTEPEMMMESESMTEPEMMMESESMTEPEMEMESESMIEPEMMMESESSLTVSIPAGTSIPGCDDTNECFLPYDISVNVGDTVTWSNDDAAVHTVTSGTFNGGTSDAFDSSILLADDTFEYTFDTVGTFEYLCIVHPWMTGMINVS